MTLSVGAYYEGWAAFNHELEEVLSGLSAEQLSWSAAPHLWSIRMLACHIVGTRSWWFHAWMGEGGEDLGRYEEFDEDEGSKTREASEIVGALRTSWASLASSLNSWTEADLSARFQRPQPRPDGERPWRTRQWIIWHVAEHDLFHAGEISQILGTHGLTGLGG